MLYDNILETIGKTPLVKLNSVSYDDVNVFGKLEYFNPSGSIKDRPAYNMILEATSSGAIDKDTVIIEPTSGNTGIGLAMVCASMKMKLILTMPENMSAERIKILKAYGAEIVLTPKKEGMRGSIEMAERLKARYGHAFIPSQFTNPANPTAHFMHTAKEIFADLNNVSWIVAGIGSGGTIMGIKRYIDTYKTSTLICGVEPKGSPLLTRGKAGAHKIQGIGANFVPKILNPDFLDAVEDVSDEDAIECAQNLAKEEGIFVGISSGAVIQAAKNLASHGEKGNIVVILPDGGMKYISTELCGE